MVCCSCIVTLLGVYTLIRFAYWIYTFATTSLKNLTGKGKDPKSFGKWAAITGSTSGIGEAYAHELAKHGVNVVLIGRNETELARVSGEIQAKHKVQTRTISLDLGKAKAEDFQRVIAELKSIDDFGILVNNAGLATDPSYFLENSIETYRDILAVNNSALVELTHGVLPILLSRKRGAIVNVSSVTALLPMPVLSLYAASKAFVDSFTLSLAAEYAGKNIVIQSLTPGYVATKMSKIKNASMMVPSAEQFALKSVASLGASDAVVGARALPWPSHFFEATLLEIVPSFAAPVLAMKQLVQARAKSQARNKK